MILSVLGMKGGIGKTSAVVALGDELFGRGFRVLLVDGDPEQGTLTTWRAISTRGNLEAPEVVSVAKIDKELPALAREVDHVLIDCPGRIDAFTKSALLVSHMALLPCGPTHPDAWALAKSAELVKTAQKYNQALQAVVLVTKRKPRTTLGKEAHAVVATSGLQVLKGSFSHRVAYEEFLGTGLGICRYVPTDLAAEEVRAVTDELFGRGGPTKATKKARKEKPRGKA